MSPSKAPLSIKSLIVMDFLFRFCEKSYPIDNFIQGLFHIALDSLPFIAAMSEREYSCPIFGPPLFIKYFR